MTMRIFLSTGNIIEMGKICRKIDSSNYYWFVRRDGNQVAHMLARYAKRVRFKHRWFDDCPNFIVNAASKNLSIWTDLSSKN